MKIMAVDDDILSLDLLGECLSEGGYECVSLLSSPNDAIKRLTETAIAYECILLDVDMPEKNGIELCAEIRRLPRYASTPIIMITRHKDRRAIEKSFSRGATDYITKPYEFFEVLTRIRIAERLVQERQAAIDSYFAAQNSARGKPLLPATLRDRSASSTVMADDPEIVSEQIMSLSVFQNYLEQVTRTDECTIDLIAIKVRRIDEIFANTSPADFVGFLKTVAGVVVEHFDSKRTFLTHVGNGTFLSAVTGACSATSAELEARMLGRLQTRKLPLVCLREIPTALIVGEPLTLKTAPKLNFRRATKAAIARVESRDSELYGMRRSLDRSNLMTNA
ncbi:response regulator [Pseudohalocynthiibacter aestuariivivens]|nr:response regulator [Pseudohalocynthiibacter aestuariivivens]QIE45546.1 response regulator [Pseudohalocynthiibacter aestuariivivens]